MKNTRKIKLTDIAKIERCKSGVLYPAGTCYIQVSACSHNSTEKWHITREEGGIPGKYAAVIPTVQVIPEYLREALEYAAGEFFVRYVGSNINIQMDMFDCYKLLFHDDINDQREVVDNIATLNKAIEEEQKQIEEWKQVKQYMLDNLIPKR